MRNAKTTLIIAVIALCTLLLLIAAPVVSTGSSETTSRTIVTSSGKALTIVPVDPGLPQPNMTADRSGTTVVLEENFDYLPNEAVMPDGWYIYDEDGNMSTWDVCNFYGYEGTCSACLAYWAGDPADDWFVSEQLIFNPGGREFAFYATHFNNEQQFQVWVSESGHSPSDFVHTGELIATETTSEDWTLYSYWVNPGGFMPTSGYLAIRCISTQTGSLFVDSIGIPNDGNPYISFDGPIVFPPPNWSWEFPLGIGYAPWIISDGTATQPPGVTPHSGGYMAEYQSYYAGWTGEQTRLFTPELDFAGYDNVYRLNFWMYHDDGLPGSDDSLKIQVSTDGGSWTTRASFPRYYSAGSYWVEHGVTLTAWAGEEEVYIGFTGESQFGNGIYIDDITLTKEAAASTCWMLKADGPFSAFISSGLETGEGFFTYFDPEEECGSPYPFKLTSLKTTFMDPGGATWPLEFDVRIYEPNDYWSSCAEPGTELYRYSFVADEASFSHPNYASVFLPEPCCIDRPVYIGIVYTNVTGPTTPSIFFDDGVGMNVCDNWLFFEGEADEFIAWDPLVGSPYFEIAGVSKSSDCEYEMLNFEDGLVTIPHADSNVSWHQIWPDDAFCTSWHQDEIAGDTTGLLDPSDTIHLSLLPERSTKKWVHMQDTRHIVKCDAGMYWGTIYAEYRGPGPDSPYWESPTLTTDKFWSLIWPYDFHNRIVEAISFDDNGNGILDEGDEITFKDRYTHYYYALVESVYTGIVVENVPLPVNCGDADASGAVDIDDVVYLINYIFTGGPEPVPYISGDANCSGGVDIDDVVWLIAYIFTGGNAPCDTDGDWELDC